MRIRRFAGAAAVILTALLGSPALAVPLYDDAFVGKTNSLLNTNPETVEAWLEKLLGGTQVNFVYDYQAPKGSDDKSLTLYNLGDWDYAVVKYAKNYAAYSDSLNDNVLSVGHLPPLGNGLLSNGISNVRFYRVLEPSALLLVGAGLVAAAPFVWSRRRRA